MNRYTAFCRGARTACRARALPALLAGLVVVLTPLAEAAPAPWHWWKSKVDGVRICAQNSPGTGWERDSKPYAGPGCAPKPRVFVVPMR